MSRELPILFSGPMVRAILDGRKTQTRRVIKPRYRDDESGFQVCTNKATGERWVEKADEHGGSFDAPRYVLPRYQPGDVLWVRETWFYEWHMYEITDGYPDLPGGRYRHRYVYKADEPDYPVNTGVGAWGWHPSIHMLREAARLFLRVTAVRAERVQDITEADAQAEGFRGFDELTDGADAELFDLTAREGFRFYWDCLPHKRGFGWEENPWVWVYEFERLEDYR